MSEQHHLLLTVSEAQKTLNLSRSKVYELLASGEIPSVRLGRSVRIPAKALEWWVESRTNNKEDL